jgi:hypothetical protein
MTGVCAYRTTGIDGFVAGTSAERGARALALEHAGALAFSRTGDPTTGEFRDAVILAQFGEVDLDSPGE